MSWHYIQDVQLFNDLFLFLFFFCVFSLIWHDMEIIISPQLQLIVRNQLRLHRHKLKFEFKTSMILLT